ncbi:MAG: DNA gyrase inhibitor YacG [Deltaproteobacteria bacterium]|nr:DNA gyrase inhibitor YacG [Deltaproteobacteria bacterium]MBI2231831.1 DNA gyrase inhibitor YacG [Deltaproteobacteria bacterium]MBI2365882.1 DNA gyrase inhibitor YacG [Deltaproteobacteria bacterium]MBI2533202.1 DNA gyrase inhibitor YacG [Deltaproteobacteria bacterium]
MRVKCPTCKTEVQWENNPHRPFCSERCRLIDLGAWATERYKIPAEEQDVDADDDDGDDQKHCN